ncbi:Pre-rRNA-processing protein TSR2-domain-containing protein [Pisolithus orientalis]|uniref:Pre-rRNA-processing protein TSR2-domain-containing protein n=1 Tax=Pisolithus orientalis TaxID=936130 RepID=UPI0022250CC0|nr:Pre-rRNA-processing protein TSR2-domain-containing protein [Pisolithus orientalis]KAI6003509.1 Pre-rRNA-processing protein TSR2-domain-containing protein [Pisolithus orientalis]
MSSPSPVIILFARGILARLKLWPALRIAVHNSWGGPESAEKRRWLAGVIVDQYEDHVPQTDAPSTSQSGLGLGTAPDASYVEEMLLQIMFDEFEVTLEDNSAYDVARDIVRLWEDVCGGRDTLVKEWEAQAERIKGNVPRMEEGARSGSDCEDTDDDEGEDSDVDMERGEGNREDVPQLLDHSRHQPEVDEEGFTTVRRKGRR